MSVPRDEQTTQADEALVARVRKLLDKAAATSSPHEAEAFSAKAAELIARHRIDPARLAEAGQRSELAVREIALGRGAYVRARLALLMAIAESHDARVVFGQGPHGTTAYVAGFTDDLDVIDVMYLSLHAQAGAQMAAVKRSTAAATQRFRRSFLFGFADRIGQLLADARQVVEREVPRADRETLALALRRREERVTTFLDERFGRTRTARPPAAAMATGWSAGAAAAERADVGRARLRARPAIGPGR